MFLKFFLSLHYLLALFVIIHAIIRARSSQAILAWVIAFIFIPYISIIFYLLFGFTRFAAYAEAIQKSSQQLLGQADELQQFKQFAYFPKASSSQLTELISVMDNMGGFVFTEHNQVSLLRNGLETYQKIFEAIEHAEDYVLLQYYIVRNDGLGRRLKDLLLRKAKQGVRIYFLYDAWGSHAFFNHHVRQLRRAGVEVASFQSIKGHWYHHWHLNFRNHRKVVIVDGKVGFTGGINFGREYLARKIPWRDTHLAMEGPGVQSLQSSFCADWYWSQRTILNLNWQAEESCAGQQVVSILSTGPEKALPTTALLITQLIHSAKHRLWISSPYFVPDRTILTALQLAVLRGVDVKILLPNSADHWLVYHCSFSFYNELQDSGIEFYRYESGFMHQKVILIDDALSNVGSINLDNRSLYINFEITALVFDKPFALEIESMLKEDFAAAKRVVLKDYENISLWFKLCVGFARLFAPIL